MNEQLKEIIKNSSLSEADKSLWQQVIETGQPQVAQAIYDFLTQEPDKLVWLTEMLKKKIEAIKAGDKNLWQEIIDEEAKEINKP